MLNREVFCSAGHYQKRFLGQLCYQQFFFFPFDAETLLVEDIQNSIIFLCGSDAIRVLNCNFGNAGIIPTKTVLIVPSDIWMSSWY